MEIRKAMWVCCGLQLLMSTISLGVEGEPEEVRFFVRKDHQSNEFLERKGVMVKRGDAPATILLLHGYGVDKYTMSPFRLLLRDYNCLSFDFRAHGEHADDEESTLGFDEVHDIFGAVDFVKSDPDLKDKPLIVVGFSMGAVSAIEAQSIDSDLFTAMFLDTPFSSSAEVLKRGMQDVKFDLFGYQFGMPGQSLIRDHAFNPYVQPVLRMLLRLKTSLNSSKINTMAKETAPSESIKKITIPAYFVVTKKDEKVSVDDVKTVYDGHFGPKGMWVANGRNHCDAVFFNPEKYEQVLNEFIQNVLNGKQLSGEILYDQPL